MSSIGFNPKSDWLSKIEYHTNKIDTFFTQRKVSETEEYIDQKTLERKEKQINKIYNFLAINFPMKDYKNLLINVEIWGDISFRYKGEMTIIEGDIPNLLLKLGKDKQLFIKLIYINKENNNIYDTYIDFIPVLKRYQNIPENIE